MRFGIGHKGSRLVGLAGLALLAGCGGETDTQSGDQVTWHADIAPLVAKHCTSCHVSGGIAPFSLTDYKSAKSVKKSMIAAVEDGTMPPWLAEDTSECKPKRAWVDDLRLTDAEKGLLRAWVDAGAPEGDPATAAKLPEPPKLDIDSPSASLPFETEYTVDGSNDDFECFVLDPGNTETVWVTAAQLRPGNQKVDHHGLLFVDVKGETPAFIEKDGRFQCFNPPSVKGYLLATWTPGATPMRMPATTGVPIPAGARLVVQMHYHPTGAGPEKDLSTVDLEWTKDQPKWEAAQALVGNFSSQKDDGTGLQPGPDDPGGTPTFIIPANKSGHTETLVYKQTVPLNLPVFSVGTHMHYVGTDMKIDLVSSDGQECLIQTPKWNFGWQRVYNYDTPIEDLPTVGLGDELHMRCTYDNTLDNPFVAASLHAQGQMQPKDVALGEQTLDEMCLGLFGIVVPPGILDKLF